MALPTLLQDTLRIPVVASPMFLASGPELLIENCKAGVVGTFPSLNQRTNEGFAQWLDQIQSELSAWEAETGKKAAPYGVNLIVHKTNPRLEQDLATCIEYKVPIIITSLGARPDLIEAVHSYGGLVFHDVINAYHGKKAADAGVDGLIAVCAGAGGHAGTTSPFALISEIRQFFDKTLLLGGSISNGNEVAAAELMGADLAYMGTRFINTDEALVEDDYKNMIIDSTSLDIVYTPKISGVNANFMRKSIESAGIDPNDLTPKGTIDFGAELTTDADNQGEKKQGAWKDIWSAGQGVGSIRETLPAAKLVDKLAEEYQQATEAHYQNFQNKYK